MPEFTIHYKLFTFTEKGIFKTAQLKKQKQEPNADVQQDKL